MHPNRTLGQLVLRYLLWITLALPFFALLPGLASDATGSIQVVEQSVQAGPGTVGPNAFGSASGFATAHAKLGDLSGSATIQADNKSSTLGSNNGATASAAFTDTATVLSNSLPFGSPVQVLASDYGMRSLQRTSACV